MVVFVCNGCGQSLKKAQVDTHGSTCKKCQSISCLDCSKEFWGDDYKSHLKCITENEKYGGKNFKPKIAAGEVKQEEWTKKIQEVIENRRKENPRMALILQQLKNYDNIPRTKPKFVRFAQNSLHILNEPIIEQVWALFIDPTDKSMDSTTGENGTSQKELTNSTSEESQNDVTNGNSKKKKKKSKTKSVDDSIELNDRIVENETNINGNSQKKKKKKSKKESVDSIELNDQTVGNVTEPNNKKKRKMCNLIENTNDTAEDLAETIETSKNKKKKRCKKNKEYTEIENDVATMEENIDKEILPIEDRDSLAETVLYVLQQTSNNELSLKKLRKKVLAKLISTNHEGKSEEKLLAKLNKKLRKMSNIKLEDERIYLISN